MTKQNGVNAWPNAAIWMRDELRSKVRLFVLYTADVIGIAGSHGVSINAYADDMQTYASCAARDQQTATSRLLACVADMDRRMKSNRLKLNADKTEFIWLATRQQLAKITPSLVYCSSRVSSWRR